jgi:hypothetical protein
MNQYSQNRKIPRLLQNTKTNKAKFQLVNGMAEFDIDGERVTMPTVEAFQRLLKKVAVLEQRLASVDNRTNRISKVRNNDRTA